MEESRRRLSKRRPYRESDSSVQMTQGTFYDDQDSPISLKDINRFGEERFRFNVPFSNLNDDEDDNYIDEESNQNFEKNEREFTAIQDLNFSGLGPKGYQRKSFRIIKEACEILAQDKYLDASGIQVGIDEKVLFLRGEVLSRSDKKRAETLVENIPGIIDVANQLVVVAPSSAGWIPGLGSIEDEA
jgi:hypothetical protein